MNTPLCARSHPLRISHEPVTGGWDTLDGELHYQIIHPDRLRPFFLSIVSSSDLWMFISSTGALTAGRRNPDLALFPYTTDDKIHDAADTTGSRTLLQVEAGRRRNLWEPFSNRQRGLYRVRRRLLKNVWGNRLVFEEFNQDLQLTFRYAWTHSNRFGIVRQATLLHHGSARVRIRLLDGVQNLMPCGVGSQFQADKSTLLDAYKRAELQPDTGLGLFRLSSIPIDRPEPAESLRTAVAWMLGLPRKTTLLSAVQLDRFRDGLPLKQETDVRGERGAYLVESVLSLAPGGHHSWCLVADTPYGPAAVVALDTALRRPARLQRELESDIRQGNEELRRIVAAADGLQQTAWSLGDARQSGNALFNVMRGGLFPQGYAIQAADLRDFVATANRPLAERHRSFWRRLKPGASHAEVLSQAAATGDPQLERLCREFLPLTFSRRHGDPSRPWNRFSIVTRKPDGSPVLNYEGNWRDIFQNWEALALSFPQFTASMVSRFASASTADGYNPYRITRDGIDWEVVDPHDPWAHIGYWGDHQIIYLLKLLEILHQHDPASLQSLLLRDAFAYANVPYRIQPYPDLVRDPKETVRFDDEAERRVRGRVEQVGSDGKLLWDARGQVLLVNLTEKILVPILAKLTNFIPEAGIWLNTQRPEWNDANNALVGNGVSLVTLCYLRRHLAFCDAVFASLPAQRIPLSLEVLAFFRTVHRILAQHAPLLRNRIPDTQRRRVLDALGQAGSRYRAGLYQRGLSGRRGSVSVASLREFLQTASRWADHSIKANQRPDGLYHAYNLVRLDRPGTLPIRRLYEMLEGQVAVLSSGQLDAAGALRVLQALRRSALYRPDQHSYLLYPNRSLPRFLDKNCLPARAAQQSRLLQLLLASDDTSLVERDAQGRVHFSGTVTNAGDVRRVLDQLAARGLARLVRQDAPRILDLFEQVFDHASFTGRSGTFFAYEGLGSIYWHMVSKLLLAAQEVHQHAVDSGAPAALLRQLAACYHDIRRGLGDCKSPAEYGAFPMDPYSHTPAHTGARQPGLTGQVKEDLLCRRGELGLLVREGRLHFRPRLLTAREFLAAPATFHYVDVHGRPRTLPQPAQSLAFTCCQVPILYLHPQASAPPSVQVRLGSQTARLPDLALDKALSQSVFAREGRIDWIRVLLEPRV